MNKAKAIVKTTQGAGGVEIREVCVRPPGTGEVVVEVAAAGVCGTDLHIMEGEWPTEPPVVMGHETSGTVVECGDGVGDEWLGAGVVAEVIIADGTCRNCLRGRRNLCENRRAIGRLADGAFTRHLTIPVQNLHRVPDGLDLLDAALAEPLACVLGALDFPPVVAPGDRVLVTGPGTVGLLAAQVARLAGGTPTVAGTPRDAGRLAVARDLGFSVVGESAPLDASAVSEQFDVVIECSGAVVAANLCLAACAKAGTYVQLGIFGAPAPIDMDQFCLKGLSLKTYYGASPHALDKALLLLADGGVAARPLISRVAALDDWESVFEQTRSGAGLKFIFDPAL
ncbi:alcohol dehydrogenase catalytic domain-containing protein [Streptomyces sp. NPDC047085]|uniref:alcohol dehydrogenase catalytic domain-containing protein n=1 Tax=Streptomyces sp. NPDC047085 TaxID=3155140 RepID=UPI0034059ECB